MSIISKQFILFQLSAGGDPADDAVNEIIKEFRIGFGGTCSVFKGKASINGETIDVALKYFNTDLNSNILLNEYKIMKNLNHRNIIQFYCFLPSQSLLVLELCGVMFEGKQLYDLYAWSKMYMERSMAVDLDLIEQILAGLSFLHGEHIVHADMKPMNFLPKGNVAKPIVKLADFGLAYSHVTTTTSTKHSSIGKGRGTDIYKGPESADPRAKWRTFGNDIYAFAFSVLELLFPERETAYGNLLEDSPTTFSILRLKMEGALPPLTDPPKHWSQEVWKYLSQVLESCLKSNPQQRPIIGNLQQKILNFTNKSTDISGFERKATTRETEESSKETEELTRETEEPTRETEEPTRETEKPTRETEEPRREIEEPTSEISELEAETLIRDEVIKNLSSQGQADEDTLKYSTPISSQEPGFDLGDTSEILFDFEVQFERTYQISTDTCEMQIKSLGLSQDTPMNTIMDKAHGNSLPIPFFPAFERFIEICRTEPSIETLMHVYDGTNSCTFLAVDIAMSITKETIGDIQRIAADAGELIITGPPRYNKSRNKEVYYNIDDVLDCQNIQARVGFNCEIFCSKKEDLIRKIVEGLCHIIGNSGEKLTRIIYICSPLAFVLCCSETCITMVDTHCVPPTENGVVMSWKGCEIQQAAAITIFKRLYLSKKESVFKEEHSMSVVIGLEEISDIPGDVERGWLDVPMRETNATQARQFKLRPHQQEAFDRIVNHKQDTLLVWATGAGKTQTTLHAIMKFANSTLIIIPTLSLMIDISSELEKRKTDHVMFSSLNSMKIEDIVEDCLTKRYKVLLSTPEYVVKLGQLNFFARFHKEVKIDMVVTEEAHCDLLWNRFRKDIVTAKKVLQPLTDVVRVAITASPPGGDDRITTDLCCLKNYFISKYGLFRKDLFIKVINRKEIKNVTDLLQAGGKQIIFCHSKQSVSDVSEICKDEFEDVFSYYGSLGTEKKILIQNQFEESTDGILVTTKAQAFGVNYSNIKHIIIYEVPDGLEMLYQMIGRASREGVSGEVIIVYSPQMMIKHFYHLNQDESIDSETANILRSSFMAIQDLAEKFDCRWRTILNYFNSLPDNSFQCQNCDICCAAEIETHDITAFAKPVLQFLANNNPLTYSTLKYLIGGQTSELNKVDTLTLERAKKYNLINLCKQVGISKSDGTQCLDDLRGGGLVDSTIKAVPGQKSSRLTISKKGSEALLLEKITVNCRKRIESRKLIFFIFFILLSVDEHFATGDDL